MPFSRLRLWYHNLRAALRLRRRLDMTPDRFQRIRQIFGSALELPAAERPAFLREACRGDLEAIAEVERLLASHQQAGSFLQPRNTEQIATVSLVVDDYAGRLMGNRYLVEKELGRGGFGVVYLARDRNVHGKAVVIKVLLKRVDDSGWFQKKFRGESEALARINHPCVVGVLDQGETPDQRPFLVMEYVEGVSLRAVMQQGRMDLRRIAALLQQVSTALDAAHRQGVFHRDLKPENIMIRQVGDRREMPVIIDFGVATVRQADSGEPEHTRVAGSFPYMAPEQLAGRPEAASDIYALGIIAFEMIAGKRPFDKDIHITEPLEAVWDGMPAPAARILRSALALDPKQRPRALEFGNQLAEALAAGKLRHPRRRFLAVAAAAMALGVAAIWYGTLGEQRILSYHIMVQQYRDGKTAGDPFRLAGEMLFPAGYHIRLVFSSTQPGYLYILNEAPAEQGSVPLVNVLFPSRADASASVAASQETAAPSGDRYFELDKQRGEEKLWIVWAKEPSLKLEAVKKWVNERDRGTIQDPGEAGEVRAFLAANSSDPKVEKDLPGKRTLVRRRGDVLVHLLRLQHF